MSREPYQRDAAGLTVGMRLLIAFNEIRVRKGWYEAACPECTKTISFADLLEHHWAACHAKGVLRDAE